MKKIIHIAIFMVLIAIFAVSIYFITITSIENIEQKNVFESMAPISEQDDNGYMKLKEQNSDFVGWIKIEDTNINYPVMQSDYYLTHNFKKEYSIYGVPFILNGINDNTIIFGHNMKTKNMFYDLTRYSNYKFYKTHKYIKFNTLQHTGNYEIIYIIKTDANSDIYSFTDFNSVEDFNSFVSKCNALSLYNINTKAEYGDKLITLSTCEYSRTNGRFLVIAKEVI